MKFIKRKIVKCWLYFLKNYCALNLYYLPKELTPSTYYDIKDSKGLLIHSLSNLKMTEAAEQGNQTRHLYRNLKYRSVDFNWNYQLPFIFTLKALKLNRQTGLINYIRHKIKNILLLKWYFAIMSLNLILVLIFQKYFVSLLKKYVPKFKICVL